MKSANAESHKGQTSQLSLTLFTSLIFLSFLAVGTMLAQDESVSVQVGAEDRAAGTYGISNLQYHILAVRGPWPEVLLDVRAPRKIQPEYSNKIPHLCLRASVLVSNVFREAWPEEYGGDERTHLLHETNSRYDALLWATMATTAVLQIAGWRRTKRKGNRDVSTSPVQQ